MADANSTEFPRTIKRNAKVLTTVIATAVACSSFTLENGFNGRDVSLDWLRANLLTEIETHQPRIRQEGPTKFCVQYHSNHWLEITVA